MWLMPSFGRPEALYRLLDAPGGWPETVYVLVNLDDPEGDRYQAVVDALAFSGRKAPWVILRVPAGSRFAEAVRHASEKHPSEPFYGIIDDDYWPITPDWHTRMVEAAGPTGVAIANNLVNFPKPYCCRVMGGDLARAIGTIAPGKMRHNYSDDTWARFAWDFGLYRPLEDVIVEHRHHLFDKGVKKDKTYERGSKDFDADTKLYQEWLNSDERREQSARVGKLLGRTITVTDFTKVHLAICVPMQDSHVDLAFHMSFSNTMRMLAQRGINASVYESSGGSHIGKARERVLWTAMAGKPEATHFLWIDDDMGWQAEQVVKLLCSGHEFSACAGVKKIDELKFCFNPLPDPAVFHPITKFLKVRHVGFAFVMLTRSVIEKMIRAYPDLRYDTGDDPPEWALFMDAFWDSPGSDLPQRLSEDFSFCQRWLDIGGEIWIDPDAGLIHAGRKEYTGIPRQAYIPHHGIGHPELEGLILAG
jgi:hypothetical protein